MEPPAIYYKPGVGAATAHREAGESPGRERSPRDGHRTVQTGPDTKTFLLIFRNGLGEEGWAFRLAPSLSGEAQAVYMAVSGVQAADSVIVKAAILD